MTSEERLFREGEEEISKAKKSSKTLKFIDNYVQKRFPKTHKGAKIFRKYLTGDEEIPTAGDILWSAIRSGLSYTFPKTSEKFGPKVFGKYWDPEAYAIVENTLSENLSGKFGLKHYAAKYGSKELDFDGKNVWGKQDGEKAYFVESLKDVLSERRYRWIKWRTGLTDKELEKAGQDYIKFHEEVESKYQKDAGKKRLTEFDHGKVQAYLLKALKDKGKLDVYKVGVLIDSQRNDIFGHYIKEHAPEDVLGDIKVALNPAYAL